MQEKIKNIKNKKNADTYLKHMHEITSQMQISQVIL